MKGQKRRQFAALPIRVGEDGQPEVMLITSRDTRRWVIPKGWPMKGRKPANAALIEAYEEAGLQGALGAKARLGRYTYVKEMLGSEGVEVQVGVFAMLVENQAADWKERDQRETQWFSVEEAAALVAEPGLSSIILKVPALLRRRERA